MFSKTDKITLDIIISACEKMKETETISEMGIKRIRKMCDCLEDSVETSTQDSK